MKKPNAGFTKRLIMALASAVADRNHDDVRVIVETLAKQHGLASFAKAVLAD
jgi:hypothetical protein